MSNKWVKSALVFLAFAIFPPSASVFGQEVIDQEFLPESFAGTGLDSGGVAQTFTVGRAGNLTRVDLLISFSASANPLPTGGLDIEILTTSGSTPPTPTLTRLGVMHVPQSMIPNSVERRDGQLVSVDFSSLEIGVLPGDVLAINVVAPSDEDYGWFRGMGYDGGRNFAMFNDRFVTTFGDIDYGFRTFVSPGCLLGDVDMLGTVNFSDIGPFITILSSGGYQCEADIDQNGGVDFLDIAPFIAMLSSQ